MGVGDGLEVSADIGVDGSVDVGADLGMDADEVIFVRQLLCAKQTHNKR